MLQSIDQQQFDANLQKNGVSNETEQDSMNPMTWDSRQWKDAFTGGIICLFVLAWCYLIMVVFGNLSLTL